MTLDEVQAKAQELLSRTMNDMSKIEIKSWVYHSTSCIKNGNPPFELAVFNHKLGMSTYLDYIRFGFIDCSDIGGKEAALNTVTKWYS